MTSTIHFNVAERLSIDFKNDSALIAECQNITAEIISGRLNLITCVEELGPFLVNKDVDSRSKGVTILSSILELLPRDFLNETELKFITTFYCDRLKDHHSIISAVLKGILALVQMKNLPHDSPSCLFCIMFDNVRCQGQPLSDRHNIYKMFDILIKTREEDLKIMGSDFVYGVISAIDGERDPRNLMFLFNVLPNFLKNFPLGHLAEEMFDVISCYFPVDFNPSATDGANITREDLAKALAPCLCASPDFAQYCLPLILDKLSSSMRVAKLDSLDLLKQGTPTFGVEGLKSHLTELWPVLRNEVMPGSDTEIRDVTLVVLITIIKTLLNDEFVYDTFISEIIADTRLSLCDVQLSLFQPAVKLLHSIAQASKNSCIKILCSTVPLILGQYSTKTVIEEKIILLEVLNNFLQLASNFELTIKNIPDLTWTDIPLLYLNDLETGNFELKKHVLNGLAIQKEILNSEQRVFIYNYICKEIETGIYEMKNICCSSLTNFAELYTEEILNIMNEKLSLEEEELNEVVKIHRIEVASAVAENSKLAKNIIPKIVSLVNSNNSKISYTAMSCLLNIIIRKERDLDIHNFLYQHCNIIEILLSLNIAVTDERLSIMSKICLLIMRKLDTKEQQEIVFKYVDILSSAEFEAMANLVMNLLIPLRQDVQLDVKTYLLDNLYKQSMENSNSNIRESSCKLLATIINKLCDDEYFGYILNIFKNQILNCIETSINIELKNRSVILLLWLSKAIIIKRSPISDEFLKCIVNILKNDAVGQHLAQNFKILVDKQEDVLIMENFCNVKFLYRQRIFEYIIKQSINHQNGSRQNYLIALTHLLGEIPMELVYMHLSEVIPLLMESLSLSNEQLVLSVLLTLKCMLNSQDVIFCEKSEGLITRFLNLTSHRQMKIRIAVLECLTEYCNYPAFVVQQHKQDVLEKLALAIDDHKRLVRRAATAARTKWFLVNAPGGIKND